MKVILLQDVKKVGKKDQTVEVSDGYANNFLFPHKLAVQVTKKSLEVLGDQKEQERLKDEENRKTAQALADKLQGLTLQITAKSGKEGKMFGSISFKQIEEEMLKQFNIKIDKRKFLDKGTIDTFGIHLLKNDLYKGVIGTIKVHVLEEN